MKNLIASCYRPCLAGIAIFLWILLSSIQSNAQTDCKPRVEEFVGTRQSLFGINLRPQAVKLLEQVEKVSGKYVREYVCPDNGGATVARSSIDSEGNPFIMILGSRGSDEDAIVHELFHL